jgi:hypothetical protein
LARSVALAVRHASNRIRGNLRLAGANEQFLGVENRALDFVAPHDRIHAAFL